MKILITGAAGFIGSRLLPFLREKGHDSQAPQFDLLDYPAIEAAVASEPWNIVIHLAAISHVPTCERDPGLALRTNVGGTALLLEAIRRRAPAAHVLFTSTAQVYQAPTEAESRSGTPIVMDENRPISPQNTYARSKWEAELLLQDAARREGLPVTILRLFNHTHKSQSPDFFLPHLYQALRAADGKPTRVPVGNLQLSRDIGCVQDLLEAFSAVIQHAANPAASERAPRIFNVCSGTPKRLDRIATGLAERVGVHAEFVTDPSRVRPGEPKTVVGSHERLTAATGWKPHAASESQLLDRFMGDE